VQLQGGAQARTLGHAQAVGALVLCLGALNHRESTCQRVVVVLDAMVQGTAKWGAASHAGSHLEKGLPDGADRRHALPLAKSHEKTDDIDMKHLPSLTWKMTPRERSAAARALSTLAGCPGSWHTCAHTACREHRSRAVSLRGRQVLSPNALPLTASGLCDMLCGKPAQPAVCYAC
jgi:hypothetical protein